MNGEIKKLKAKMRNKLKQKGNFLDEEVQKISQELDEKIVEYMEKKQKNKIRKPDEKNK